MNVNKENWFQSVPVFGGDWTYHLLLEQEQGLFTQLSSLSESASNFSPQW